MKYDVFISYRRTSSETATLIAEKLRSFGYRVFLDVETLNSGKFNEQLLAEIEQCKDVVVVLPENALDRCVDPEDWVRKEVCYAMQHRKNIIPVMLRNFSWPDVMPEGMEELKNYQAVSAGSHEFFDLAMQRLSKYLKSRPRAKYHAMILRSLIIVSAIVLSALIAYSVFRTVAVPVCTEAANALTSEMATIDELAGINNNLKREWDNFLQQLDSARTPQKLQNVKNDILSAVDQSEKEANKLRATSILYSDTDYSVYQTFLLALYGIDVADLKASSIYTNSMFDDMLYNIENMRKNIEYIDLEYSGVLNKMIVEDNFKCYQYSVNIFYFGHMELMSHMPQKSRATHEKISAMWQNISQAVPLSLKPEEYQKLQQAEMNKIAIITRNQIANGEIAENDLLLRQNKLDEAERQYDEVYKQLLERCQLKEGDQVEEMWNKILCWGDLLGSIVEDSKEAAQQGEETSSVVTPGRALSDMNALLSSFQKHIPASSAFIPSVKAFFKGVVDNKYQLGGVLVFVFENDATHPLYRVGDIIVERNGITITDYSQMVEAVKINKGGTVKFLRLENGSLREHSERVPESEVNIGFMNLKMYIPENGNN